VLAIQWQLTAKEFGMDNNHEKSMINFLKANFHRLTTEEQINRLATVCKHFKDDMSGLAREEIAKHINHVVSFLLTFKAGDNERHLIEVSQLIHEIKHSEGANGQTVLSLLNLLDWMKSDYRDTVGIHANNYLNEMNFWDCGAILPRLFYEGDMKAPDDFWERAISTYSIPIRIAVATSAAIQHLRYGDNVFCGEDKNRDWIFGLFTQDSYASDTQSHAQWLMRFHEECGVIDHQRTYNFLEAYSAYFVDHANKSKPAGLDRLAFNLELISSDRSLTLNRHSKRLILSADFGL
jgi:hypothetical protein